MCRKFRATRVRSSRHDIAEQAKLSIGLSNRVCQWCQLIRLAYDRSQLTARVRIMLHIPLCSSLSRAIDDRPSEVCLAIWQRVKALRTQYSPCARSTRQIHVLWQCRVSRCPCLVSMPFSHASCPCLTTPSSLECLTPSTPIDETAVCV